MQLPSMKSLCRTGRKAALAAVVALGGFTAVSANALVSPTDNLVVTKDHWFEKFKATATDKELYTFLYAMPKGGDLHNHLFGAVLDDWWFDLVLSQEKYGYVYYTKVKINNCAGYDHNEFTRRPYYLMFANILEKTYNELSECEKGEYKLIKELTPEERKAWADGMVLNHDHEGRDEFFEKVWPRVGELGASPYLGAELLYLNMKAFGDEGLTYLEAMHGAHGYRTPQGEPIPAEQTVEIYKKRLAQPDAKATGVTVRLLETVLRFSPTAEEQMKRYYESVEKFRDLYVGVNMAGREDNDKGHPLRFLKTLRELRQKHNSVRLSIHAGEVDEPNYHIRDTIMMGADRIGHGINLITDTELLRQMRHGPYMVEINLISNLLLEYVDDYSQHPFPEYLRLGIPVALSTDDRGMWDSNLTDEFFVAVKEFNLSWSEILQLSRNSLQYSFVEGDVKKQLLDNYDKRASQFEKQFISKGVAGLKSVKPVSYGFTCKRYQLCDFK